MFNFLHTYTPQPILITIGSISVHWYGLILAVGMLVGYFLVSLRGRSPKATDSLAVAWDRLRHPGINRVGLGIASPPSAYGYGWLTMTSDALGSVYINLLFWGLVGARLYHVLNEWQLYWQEPLAIFKIWQGGLAIHGGIMAGAAALFYYARKNRNRLSLRGVRLRRSIPPPHQSAGSGQAPQSYSRNEAITSPDILNRDIQIASSATLRLGYGWLPRNDIWARFLSLADLFSLPLILGQGLGRWGNYFNQELFGRPTGLPWGIPIAPVNRPVGFEQYQYFHPTFLYESLWDLAVFGFLLTLTLTLSLKGRGDRQGNVLSLQEPAPYLIRGRGEGEGSGRVFSWYLILYGLGRLATELLRIDAVPLILGVRLPLLASGSIVLVGVMLLWQRRTLAVT